MCPIRDVCAARPCCFELESRRVSGARDERGKVSLVRYEDEAQRHDECGEHEMEVRVLRRELGATSGPESGPAPEPEPEPEPELEPEPEPEPAEPQPSPATEGKGFPKVAAAGDAGPSYVVLAPEGPGADGGTSVVASRDADKPRDVGRRRSYKLARLEPADSDTDFLSIEKADVASVVEAILEVEAPIEEGLLYRRITKHFGVRMGSKVRAKCEEGVKAAHGRRVTQAGRTIVWLRGQDPKSYVVYRVPQGEDARRAFDELPLEEIAAAALEFIENNGPSEQEDLVRGVLHELEFSRLTAAAREYLQKGLTFGIRRGLYKRNKSTYLLPDAEE